MIARIDEFEHNGYDLDMLRLQYVIDDFIPDLMVKIIGVDISHIAPEIAAYS